MPSTDFTIHLSIPRGTPPSPGVDRAMRLRLPKLNEDGRPLGRISRHLGLVPVLSQTGYVLDSGSPRLWRHVGRGPSPRPPAPPSPPARPPARPPSRRTRASAGVQGARPTKPMPERLPESSAYPV